MVGMEMEDGRYGDGRYVDRQMSIEVSVRGVRAVDSCQRATACWVIRSPARLSGHIHYSYHPSSLAHTQTPAHQHHQQ